MDARRVHISYIIAISADTGGIGGHCRRSGQDSGSWVGRFGGSGVGVGGRVAGGHLDLVCRYILDEISYATLTSAVRMERG